jgi:hypothetical protein
MPTSSIHYLSYVSSWIRQHARHLDNQLSPCLSGEFDQLVKEACAGGGDAKRTQMFKDAEKILVDDVVFCLSCHRQYL